MVKKEDWASGLVPERLGVLFTKKHSPLALQKVLLRLE